MDRALLAALLIERFGPDARLMDGDDMTTKYRPQLVADGHIPTIAEMGHDTPTWGVMCHRCSQLAEDYVWPCREGVTYEVPAEVVAATALAAAREETAQARSNALSYLANQGNRNMQLERDLAAAREELAEAKREVHLLKHTDDGRLFVAETMLEHARRDLGAYRRAEHNRPILADLDRLMRERDAARAEADQLWADREAVLDWARHNLGNSLIHKRIRECYGLPVDAVTMASPEVHALAAAPKPACGDATFGEPCALPKGHDMHLRADQLAAAPQPDEPAPFDCAPECRCGRGKPQATVTLPTLPSCAKGCPGVLCDHPEACPLDAVPGAGEQAAEASTDGQDTGKPVLSAPCACGDCRLCIRRDCDCSCHDATHAVPSAGPETTGDNGETAR
jgi:hypothetical protein